MKEKINMRIHVPALVINIHCTARVIYLLSCFYDSEFLHMVIWDGDSII